MEDRVNSEVLKVVHQEEAGTGGPKLLEGSTERRPNDVEVAPGIYRLSNRSKPAKHNHLKTGQREPKPKP